MSDEIETAPELAPATAESTPPPLATVEQRRFGIPSKVVQDAFVDNVVVKLYIGQRDDDRDVIDKETLPKVFIAIVDQDYLVKQPGAEEWVETSKCAVCRRMLLTEDSALRSTVFSAPGSESNDGNVTRYYNQRGAQQVAFMAVDNVSSGVSPRGLFASKVVAEGDGQKQSVDALHVECMLRHHLVLRYHFNVPSFEPADPFYGQIAGGRPTDYYEFAIPAKSLDIVETLLSFDIPMGPDDDSDIDSEGPGIKIGNKLLVPLYMLVELTIGLDHIVRAPGAKETSRGTVVAPLYESEDQNLDLLRKLAQSRYQMLEKQLDDIQSGEDLDTWTKLALFDENFSGDGFGTELPSGAGRVRAECLVLYGAMRIFSDAVVAKKGETPPLGALFVSHVAAADPELIDYAVRRLATVEERVFFEERPETHTGKLLVRPNTYMDGLESLLMLVAVKGVLGTLKTLLHSDPSHLLHLDVFTTVDRNPGSTIIERVATLADDDESIAKLSVIVDALGGQVARVVAAPQPGISEVDEFRPAYAPTLSVLYWIAFGETQNSVEMYRELNVDASTLINLPSTVNGEYTPLIIATRRDNYHLVDWMLREGTDDPLERTSLALSSSQAKFPISPAEYAMTLDHGNTLGTLLRNSVATAYATAPPGFLKYNVDTETFDPIVSTAEALPNNVPAFESLYNGVLAPISIPMFAAQSSVGSVAAIQYEMQQNGYTSTQIADLFLRTASPIGHTALTWAMRAGEGGVIQTLLLLLPNSNAFEADGVSVEEVEAAEEEFYAIGYRPQEEPGNGFPLGRSVNLFELAGLYHASSFVIQLLASKYAQDELLANAAGPESALSLALKTRAVSLNFELQRERFGADAPPLRNEFRSTTAQYLETVRALVDIYGVKRVVEQREFATDEEARQVLVTYTDNFSALHLAARQLDADFIETIVAEADASGESDSINWDVRDIQGRTALYLCTEAITELPPPVAAGTGAPEKTSPEFDPRARYERISKALLDKGASPSIVDVNGKSSVDLAREAGVTDVLEILGSEALKQLVGRFRKRAKERKDGGAKTKPAAAVPATK